MIEIWLAGIGALFLLGGAAILLLVVLSVFADMRRQTRRRDLIAKVTAGDVLGDEAEAYLKEMTQ